MTELLRVDTLEKHFPVANATGFGRAPPQWLHAVDDVSFSIAPGESVGLVGESGCGKSTLARVLARLIDPTEGRVWFEGHDIGNVPAHRFMRVPVRRAIQMVFQDSVTSLNPRFTASDTLAEPLKLLLGLRDKNALNARIAELAEQVGLPHELLARYPHQLSGGQKARVNIARALASNPKLLILDEPTAALDVSVQAIILKLLADLRARLGMSYLFVSHDLNVVRLLCDRVLVMYLGKIVEIGPADELFRAPRHPYTAELIAAIPRLGGDGSPRPVPSGEPRSPIDPSPHECRFYGRCARAIDQCAHQMPELAIVTATHRVACFHPCNSLAS